MKLAIIGIIVSYIAIMAAAILFEKRSESDDKIVLNKNEWACVDIMVKQDMKQLTSSSWDVSTTIQCSVYKLK